MAYISKGPVYGSFQKQSLAIDGVLTAFSLRYAVGSASSLLVSVGGVIQEPSIAYNIRNGGSEIIFSEAPTKQTYLIYLGKQYLVPVVSGYEVGLEQFVSDGASDRVTLSSLPVINSGVLVFINGVQQSFGSAKNFYLSGNEVVFTSIPLVGSEIDVYILAREKVSIDTVSDDVISRAKLSPSIKSSVGQWTIISANTLLIPGYWYMVDTLGGSKTITLPASPVVGETFKIMDYSGTFATNNCIVARNGNKIEGATSDLTLSVSAADIELRFTGNTFGWRLA